MLLLLSNFYDRPPFILEVAVFKCPRTCLNTLHTWESNPQYATNALTLYKYSLDYHSQKSTVSFTG